MSKIKNNGDKCPLIAVGGAVQQPTFKGQRIDAVTGIPKNVISTGGIVLNCTLGDKVMGIAGDHVEPCVSTRHPNSDKSFNDAYLAYSCIGNEAVVTSGKAKGKKGFVMGKHGGCDHLILHFDKNTIGELANTDTFMVKAHGQGMSLTDHPEVVLRSMSPQLLEKLNIKEKDGKLVVGVAKTIPSDLMGSGIGAPSSDNGDFDICLTHPTLMKKHNLYDLRFGDIVAVLDCDCRHGMGSRENATTIGVVVHSDCILPGHGPGVTVLMSAVDGKIVPEIDEKATLKDFFVKK